MTDLHRAANRNLGHAVIVRAYLDGASLDVRDEVGATPLHLSLRIQPSLLPASGFLLLALGAAPDIADARGVRPLHLACALGYAPMVRLLLALGADRQAPDADGKTPADRVTPRATRPKDEAIIRRLLRGRSAPLPLRGLSLLDTVVDYDKLPHTAALLRAGADPNVEDADGKRPLHRCVSPAMIAGLLARGAEPSVQDDSGVTPLHLAARGLGEEIDLLLDFGADPDLRDARGRQPLDELLAQNYEDDFYDGGRLEDRRARLIAKLKSCS